MRTFALTVLLTMSTLGASSALASSSEASREREWSRRVLEKVPLDWRIQEDQNGQVKRTVIISLGFLLERALHLARTKTAESFGLVLRDPHAYFSDLDREWETRLDTLRHQVHPDIWDRLNKIPDLKLRKNTFVGFNQERRKLKEASVENVFDMALSLAFRRWEATWSVDSPKVLRVVSEALEELVQRLEI